jgi:hypothetical protein
MDNQKPFEDLLREYGFEEHQIKNDVYEYRKKSNPNFFKIDGPNAQIFIDDICRYYKVYTYQCVLLFIWYNELTEEERNVISDRCDFNYYAELFEPSGRDGCLGREHPSIFDKYDAINKRSYNVGGLD